MERTLKTLYRIGLMASALMLAGMGPMEVLPKPGDPPRGTVLTGEAAVELSASFFTYPPPPPSARGIWQPGPSDIARFEKLLPGFLKTQKLPPDFCPLHEYYRQYVGIVRDGKKIIGVNFINIQDAISIFNLQSASGEGRGKMEDFWSQPVVVADGGAHFFYIQLEVDTGTFSHLIFNGYV
jgi:hypothetical protein